VTWEGGDGGRVVRDRTVGGRAIGDEEEEEAACAYLTGICASVTWE